MRRVAIVMVDLSRHMCDMITLEGRVRRRGEIAVEWLNAILIELYRLTYRGSCSHDCIDVMVLGYSGAGVELIFGDEHEPFVPIVDIAKLSPEGQWMTIRSLSPLDSPDEYSDLAKDAALVDFDGGSPMYEAYLVALEQLRRWRERRAGENSLMPYVINIAGGEPSDCDLQTIEHISQQIKDEAVVVMNMLLSDACDSRYCSVLPRDEELRRNPNPLIRTFAAAASLLQDDDVLGDMLRVAYEYREVEALEGGCRAFACNCSIEWLLE